MFIEKTKWLGLGQDPSVTSIANAKRPLGSDSKRKPQMPTYFYNCPNCSKEFKIIRGMNDVEDNTCPDCGAEAKRDFTIGRIKFKGEGFYSTDKAE